MTRNSWRPQHLIGWCRSLLKNKVILPENICSSRRQNPPSCTRRLCSNKSKNLGDVRRAGGGEIQCPSLPTASSKRPMHAYMTITEFHVIAFGHGIPSNTTRATPKTASVLITPARVASFVLFGASAVIYFWMLPRLKALGDELNALRIENSMLIKAKEECQRTHIKAQDVLADSSQAHNTQSLGISFYALLVPLFMKLCSQFNTLLDT